MFDIDDEQTNSIMSAPQRRPQKKITPQRLKNIGLYYLKRFESSVENLRAVLRRRIDAYARENPDWNKNEAYQWAENIIEEFERLHYLDDRRFAEMKVRGYLNAGKPARYIQNKLRAKGVAEEQIEAILSEQEYNQSKMALKFAQRKKIGPYRLPEARRQFRQKDMATLIRAGFDFDVVCEVLDYDENEE